jgi:hypothetical protein
MKENTHNHPMHYNNFKTLDEDGTAKYEPIKVMDELYMSYGYYFGSALKYIARAPHKGQMISDYKKALFCIEKIKQPVLRQPGARLSLIVDAVEDWDVPEAIASVLPSVWLGDTEIAIEKLKNFIEELEVEKENG